MAPAPGQLVARAPDVVVRSGRGALVYGGDINGGSFTYGALFTP